MRRDISRWFRKVGIEFQPDDLRYACAIRAHLQGIPIKATADNLGHTVDKHTKTYGSTVLVMLNYQSERGNRKDQGTG